MNASCAEEYHTQDMQFTVTLNDARVHCIVQPALVPHLCHSTGIASVIATAVYYEFLTLYTGSVKETC